VDAETSDGPPRALLIAAIVLAVGAIIAVLVIAALRQNKPGQQAVPIAGMPAPKAQSAECRTLTGAPPRSSPHRPGPLLGRRAESPSFCAAG
jgi:hypothetical protein